MPRSNRSRNRALFAAALILGVLAIVEAMAVATSAFLAQRGVLYEPQGMDDYEAYLANRDPVLGWPAPRAGPGPEGPDPSRDARGARRSPDSGRANCAEVYGDSFTYGTNVSDDETYSHLLSMRFGCRVANFGVEGYGSDQALMSYIDRNSADPSVVVLAHLSENVMRNVNQFRGLLYSTAREGFKPRFILGSHGELVRVPIPSIAPERYASFVSAPESFLEHEYFAPGGSSGTTTRGFPHLLALVRAVGHFHVRAQLSGEAWYARFYRPDHPSHALQLTTGIFREFVRIAHSRGQTPLVAILATQLDFLEPEQRQQRGQRGTGIAWAHQPLLDALDREGIAYVDTSGGFELSMGARPVQDFFFNGHPTSEGHRILAGLVEERLRALRVSLETRSPATASN